MKKLTGILIGILVLGLSVGVYASGFTDLPNTHWAYESVQWAVSEGLIEGYDDGTYKPNKEITEQEFSSILARYTYKGNKDELKAPAGTYWADGYYKFLQQFQLPLKGYNNQKAKATALTRGDIARVIAAKNGFNLTERQAIYYMYENDISYGLIDGQLTFDSYGVDKAVSRAQIPAFFQRLSEKEHTTFMGKPSNVTGKEIGGISGVPQDKTEITDKMFDDLAKDKGVTNPSKPSGTLSGKIANGDFSGGKSVADKHGLKFDVFDSGFELKNKEDNKTTFAYDQGSREGLFDINIKNYQKDKQMLIDTLKLTGKFTDAEIKKVIDIVDGKTEPDITYKISEGKFMTVVGAKDGSLRGLTVGFGINE